MIWLLEVPAEIPRYLTITDLLLCVHRFGSKKVTQVLARAGINRWRYEQSPRELTLPERASVTRVLTRCLH